MRRESFVSTYKTVIGWKAAVFIFDEELGCHVPEFTGYYAHETEADAAFDTMEWALADGLEYKSRT